MDKQLCLQHPLVKVLYFFRRDFQPITLYDRLFVRVVKTNLTSSGRLWWIFGIVSRWCCPALIMLYLCFMQWYGTIQQEKSSLYFERLILSNFGLRLALLRVLLCSILVLRNELWTIQLNSLRRTSTLLASPISYTDVALVVALDPVPPRIFFMSWKIWKALDVLVLRVWIWSVEKLLWHMANFFRLLRSLRVDLRHRLFVCMFMLQKASEALHANEDKATNIYSYRTVVDGVTSSGHQNDVFREV
jgi:hypothetical protein